MQLGPARNTLAGQLASLLARLQAWSQGLGTLPHCHMLSSPGPRGLVGTSSVQGLRRGGRRPATHGQWL